MTHEQLLEKRRDGFEEWVKDNWYNSDIRLLRDPDDRDYYKFVPTQRAWIAWNAALDSVEIELPSAPEVKKGRDSYTKEQSAFHQGLMSCALAIQQQGYKVKL